MAKKRSNEGAGTSNAAIADALREMALFLEMEGVAFKPQAYEKAASAVRVFDRPLSEIHAEGGVKALAQVSGIGKGIAERNGGQLGQKRGRKRDRKQEEEVHVTWLRENSCVCVQTGRSIVPGVGEITRMDGLTGPTVIGSDANVPP